MSSRPPAAFQTAALCAALFGTLMVVAVATLQPGTLAPLQAMWLRAAAALLAAFSGVAFEALWRRRPWAWRASVGLAMAYAVLTTALFVALHGSAGGWLRAMVPSAAAVSTILWTVRQEAAAMAHAAPRRRPAPRP